MNTMYFRCAKSIFSTKYTWTNTMLWFIGFQTTISVHIDNFCSYKNKFFVFLFTGIITRFLMIVATEHKRWKLCLIVGRLLDNLTPLVRISKDLKNDQILKFWKMSHRIVSYADIRCHKGGSSWCKKISLQLQINFSAFVVL